MKRSLAPITLVAILPLVACGGSPASSVASASTPRMNTSSSLLTVDEMAKLLRCQATGVGMDLTGVIGADAEDFTSCHWDNAASGEVVLARLDSASQAQKDNAKIKTLAHYAYENFIVFGDKSAVGVAQYCQKSDTPKGACGD